MMHPMWPDGGFYVDPGERKLGAAELGDALTQAVQRRDTAAARDVFDHAFWHKTDFHPDWLHLYLAVSNKDREMVKLLTAYGATWTEDQAKIACANLADRLDNLHGPLHAAGIRTDYTARDLETVDVLTVFEMNSRLLDLNRRNGHDVSATEAAFRTAVSAETVRAALQDDKERLKKLLRCRQAIDKDPGGQAIDVSAEFAAALGDYLSSSSARALLLLDRLREAGARLAPIDLGRVSPLVLSQHYDMLPDLAARGLLHPDQQRLRQELLHAWSFLQRRIDLDGYVLDIPEAALAAQRNSCRQAAAVLCTKQSPITPREAENVVDLHRRYARGFAEGLRDMDDALLATGYFDNPAFSAAQLGALAETVHDDARLCEAFNKKAQRKTLSEKGMDYFLHPKRYEPLSQALRSGAWVPNAVETEEILDYFHGRMKKDVVTEDMMQDLKAMKRHGADFSRLRMRNYLGWRRPGLAKALLDADILGPRDMNIAQLRKRCGNAGGIGAALFANENDKHFAMREFLYQVMLERMDPDTYKPLRAHPRPCYQRRYVLDMLRTARAAEARRRKPPQIPPRPKNPGR